MIKKIIIFLILNVQIAYGFSVDETKVISNKVILKHQYEIMRTIPFLFDPRLLNQLPICHYYCSILKKYLDQETDLKTKVIRTQGHSYILTSDDIVIDPTWRQFFTYSAMEHGYKLNALPNLFKKLGMPTVLVVSRGNLLDTLESFGLDPNWKTYLLDCAVDHKKMVCQPTKYNFDYYYR